MTTSTYPKLSTLTLLPLVQSLDLSRYTKHQAIQKTYPIIGIISFDYLEGIFWAAPARRMWYRAEHQFGSTRMIHHVIFPVCIWCILFLSIVFIFLNQAGLVLPQCNSVLVRDTFDLKQFEDLKNLCPKFRGAQIWRFEDLQTRKWLVRLRVQICILRNLQFTEHSGLLQ